MKEKEEAHDPPWSCIGSPPRPPPPTHLGVRPRVRFAGSAKDLPRARRRALAQARGEGGGEQEAFARREVPPLRKQNLFFPLGSDISGGGKGARAEACEANSRQAGRESGLEELAVPSCPVSFPGPGPPPPPPLPSLRLGCESSRTCCCCCCPPVPCIGRATRCGCANWTRRTCLRFGSPRRR